MRGFPPTQIILLIVAFALLAVPLAHLTGSFSTASTAELNLELGRGDNKLVVQGSADHPEEDHVHADVAAIIRVRFAHKPLTLSLQQDGKEFFVEPDLSQSAIEVDTEIEVSHDGNELIVAATWPEGTPATALTVEIEPEGLDGQSQTRWTSEAALDEVLTFQW